MADPITGDLAADHGRGLDEATYARLRGIARRELARLGRQPTLNPTALVNEAWLKLVSADGRWESRAHFLSAMARVMRHVLIDYAREQGAQRRGGNLLKVTLDGLSLNDAAQAQAIEMLAIDRALQQLARLDPRLEQVIELRFFAGLTVAEIALALGLSEPTIKRDLRSARAFIASELGHGD